MNIVSFIVFVALQLIFLPIGLLGVLLVAYKQMVISKRLGVSQTAIEVLNGRISGETQRPEAHSLRTSMGRG